MERLLSVKEAAEKLNVPVSWIYERTRTKQISFIRLGKYVRFTEEMIDQIARDGLK